MRVTEQLHHLDLTKYLLEVVDVQLRLVNDLDRHLVNVQRTIIMSDSHITDN